MILVDVNLMVYAKMDSLEQHEASRRWLEERLSGGPRSPRSRPTDTPRSSRVLMPRVGRPGHVHDAHLAALAIEYGLTLQTTDRDFARFGGLKWENPLEA